MASHLFLSASTRTLYEKKLRELLKPVSQPPLNGAGYAAQFSDVEDDDDDDEEEHDYGVKKNPLFCLHWKQ